MEAVEIARWLCVSDTVNRCLVLLEQGFKIGDPVTVSSLGSCIIGNRL